MIEKDLLSGETNQKCAIDDFFACPKEFERRVTEGKYNKATVSFLNTSSAKLRKIFEKGTIPFFKRYEYEMVLNEYIQAIYHTSKIEMTNFPSEKSLKKQEEFERKCKENEEYERRHKETIKLEQSILEDIEKIVWKRVFGGSSVRYESEYRGKSIVFSISTLPCKKTKIIPHSFKYEDKEIESNYNISDVQKRIESTKPKNIPNKKIICVSKPYNSRRIEGIASTGTILSEDERKKIEREEKKRKKAEERKRQIREQQANLRLTNKKKNEEQRIAAEEKKRLLKEQKEEQARIEAEIEQKRQEELRNLPQIGIRDFVVRRAVFRCMNAKHSVVDLDAVVTIVDRDDHEKMVKVSAGYCQACNIYFIMESTYESLKRKGILLCRVSDEKSYLKNIFVNGMHLAQESILRQYGYNVSQEEGLSSARRQKILALMVDKHIITRSEIISYLDFFISQRMYQSKYELAISKWEADRDFIEGYRIGEYSQYGVNAIYRR